jgi:O-antigen ligase
MVVWLLQQANSATSLVCFLITGSLIATERITGINYAVLPRAAVIVGLFVIMPTALWWQDIVTLLGRDPSLTGRTDIWQRVLSIEINPIVGTGYESFWHGDRVKALSEQYHFHINQAHSGYLEIYLSLGYVGLFLFIAMIVSSYRQILRRAPHAPNLGLLRLACLIAFVVSNVTEAGIRGASFTWFIALLILVDYVPLQEMTESIADASSSKRAAIPPVRLHPGRP